MKDVKRHNPEFIRTEVLNLSIEVFADKIGVSKSSYQRMKSESYDTEYYFAPLQKACELANISLDVFATQYLTKELYKKYKGKHGYKKTPAIVLSKKQWLAVLLFGVIILGFVLSENIVSRDLENVQSQPVNIEEEVQEEIPVKSLDIPEQSAIYYWTNKPGGSYHLNRNCPIIKRKDNIESGPIENAYKKQKFDPCDFCIIE